MRLLKRLPGDTLELTSVDDNFELASFDDDDPPPYAILSHTWIPDQEVTYQELEAGAGRNKSGFDKIRFCGRQAAVDGLEYFWVDTCCIDKSSHRELDTAINYMFRWYQRASKCYVYLPDVSVPEHDAAAFKIRWSNAFVRSRWFTRGWTLQELIAPASVQFFSKEHKLLGDKMSLEQEIHHATGIPISALRGQSLATFSVEERMRWGASRRTTVKEDRVYCLLGIFGVFLPVIHGEGEAYARKRLEEEIQKRQEGSMIEQISSSAIDAARLETKRPSCVIPFHRDPHFVDRGTLLDELQDKYSARAARVALIGLGGVGKSQLAIEFCYRTADRSPDTWIFWVHAGSVERLEQSYQDIADQVGIASRTDAQADVFELVRNWLRSEQNGKWLLVLDNADDDAVVTSLPRTRDQQHLTRYLPQSNHGMVIVTSRSAHVTSRLVEDRDTFHLEPMHESSAQALLVKKMGHNIDVNGINELAAALEYMPLALVQAATYIQKRAPHYSVKRYLEEFRRSDKRKARLLSQEAGHLRRNEDAKNSILVTWQISFDHIRSIKKSATDILSLMSFFDRQGIPKALLRSRSAIHVADDRRWANEEEERDVEEESTSESEIDAESDIDDEFIDDLLLLKDYSFISETTDAETLEMHRLVQLATQNWLEAKGEIEGWRQHFIGNMCRAFPYGKYENWGICQGLFPHVVVALRKQPRDEESRKEWATLLYNAAWYAEERGDFQNAISLAMASMESRKMIFGAESKVTLQSMAMVGLAKRLGGQLEEAEKLQVQLIETYRTKLGADYPHTLISMGNLASIFWNQGRWEEAEKLEMQVLETRRTKLGADHPDTLISMGNLASIFWNQGRWEEAGKLEVQVLETRRTKLGADYPDTLISMSNLASIFWNQGRWEEAGKLKVQVLETRRTKLGADHPDTLISMSNLASTFWNQGQWEEAEKLEVQVLETSKTKLGADHPDTLINMNNLAFTWKSLGRVVEAINLMQQCVQRSEKVLGVRHPQYRGSLSALEEWERERADIELCDMFKDMRL